MPAGEFLPLCIHDAGHRPGAKRTCQSPPGHSPATPAPGIVGDPPMRFMFAESAGTPPAPDTSQSRNRTDLEMVEDLLDRCWQELGSSELNAKMTDIVRLLEFKNKLRATAEAEETFWALINHLRHEELSDFGLVSMPVTTLEPVS
jgi:hypothetical protein